MIIFLIDLLAIALLVAGRHHDLEFGSGRHAESVDQPTGDPVSSQQQQPPGGRAVRAPQRGTASPSPRPSTCSRLGAGELTKSEIPVWTALDDHQLTRLLKQSSS